MAFGNTTICNAIAAARAAEVRAGSPVMVYRPMRFTLEFSSATDSSMQISEPVLDIPPVTRDEIKQGLRLRRFLLASVFSVLYLVVLAVFYTQEKVDRETLLHACAVVAAFILVFFGLFRLGLNLRFPDPSLTGWQLLASVFTMLYVIYRAPDSRIAFTAFFFVAMMFGMLRHSGMKLAALGSISLLSFAFVIGLRYSNNRDIEMLRLDMLQVVVMAVTFP